MSDAIQNDAIGRMDKAIDALRTEFGKVRTGRANPAILSDLRIDYYGVPTPITQVAGVKAADGHQLVIDPWDKKSLSAIEKAIMASDLGITPTNDGNVIRLPFPAPSEEGRKEIVKQCRELAEEARVSIRNVRRDANNRYERQEKDGEISEDEVNRGKAAIQKITDGHIATVDSVLKAKEAEVMEV
ncbi:MAG: ribosome recycling factor [Coriobacteriales bacterium]|jgi:ribosome recycling factor